MPIRVNQLPLAPTVSGSDFAIVDQSGVTRIATLQTLFNNLSAPFPFDNSVTASLAASQNDYTPSGYQAGNTNRLILTPPSGGAVITGLLASTDGWSLQLVNNSGTDSITLTHAGSGSAAVNQFLCSDSLDAVLSPYGCTLIIYTVNRWRFV